ncbi:uncharacterized protein LOC132190901 [Corylus avellana]|uniref:uncharacterized protein LOC132190901 n=1 Tax=Corylus avellana TaxID=13451 RepID=UPI00286B4443|nr:uncharacterized protein LOC132190901 [Corylus avellana]
MQKISNAGMMDRRKKGLFYNCDAKWSRDHVCASPRLFLIEEIEENVNMLKEVEEEFDLEYWYNATWYASTKITPYEAVYDLLPPQLLTYIPGTTKLEAVDETLHSREQILSLLLHNLQQAQQMMKNYADLRISERKFEVGHMVYLWLQPYRQQSVVTCKSLKLSRLFYGSFQIICKVGEVAYDLDLPIEARFHPIFHVSQLKLKLGTTNYLLPKLPPVDLHGVLQPEPLKILAR